MTRGLWLKTLILVLVFAASAHAQSSLGIGTAEPGLAPGGPLGGYGSGFFGLINQGQQDFYRALTTALKAMRADPWQLWSLIGLSFAYGVFHAAGPGHGKAVISSYMIANETALRRGIVLAFLSAFLQGAVAILLIVAGWLILRGTSVTLTVATHWMELASFALVIAFGLRLLVRKIRALTGHGDGHDHHHHDHTHVHDHHHHHHHHHHDHTHQHHDHGHDHGHHAQDHGHAHAEGEVCAECGHMHMPDPALLKKRDFSLQDAWSAVVAVGMRPCSGALLVLTFSLLNGLYLGGILSVIAMSFGTALTVSALAILAVSAKGAALRLTGAESRIGTLIGHAIEIGGALLVILLGSILLIAGLAG